MKSFSQRKGIVPVADIIQVNSMNVDLRNSLWNILFVTIWTNNQFLSGYGKPGIEQFSRSLWFSYFKLPIDRRPDDAYFILEEIRTYFFSCAWNEVYDFIEFVVSYYDKVFPGFSKLINEILEIESSGYRVVSGHIVDITSEQEVEMLENAIRDTQFAGVAAHLERALELLSDRGHPDYRNSIKESISAIESMARIVAQDSRAMLPDALKTMEKNGRLHTALKEGFIKLYGYTSDEDGIRHAMLNEPNISAIDAKFFLLSCTSFSNYLKAQLP
ncbi:MAG: AbiJ-NTD4 domain-containing protein [Sulfuriferula sp.]